MNFTEIDLQSWPRGPMFHYFSKMEPTGYSLTVDMDVTELRAILKKNKLKFFPAYVWLVTKNLNEQIEFKVAEKDGVIGYYDKLTPLYVNYHEDDHTFSFMWTEYTDCFLEYYNGYLKNKEEFGDNRGVLCQPHTLPPASAYIISCVPWIKFNHFAIHSYQNKPYYFPTVEAGKFFEENGRTLMPFSITCHHATTDGYHVNKFLESLQDDMDNFEKYL